MAGSRHSISGSTCAAVAALAFLLSMSACALSAHAAVGRRGLLQSGDTSPAVPPQCINTGLQLQSSCTKELENASTAFGLSPTAEVSSIQVDNSKLKEFLKTAPPPSADCCSATTAFNNAYCSCSKEVLDLVKSFTNNNIDQYREVAMWLESQCKTVGKPFTLYMGNTCPAGKRL